MKIPIANAFRLLAYAWDVAEEADEWLAGAETLHAPIDVLGHALASAASDLIRRGVRREYVEADMGVAGIRGKLLLAPTLQRNMLASARTVCRVTELTEDTLANRLLRSTIHGLLGLPVLDRAVRAHLEEVYSRLSTIPQMRVRSADFRRVQIHRNNRLYRLILSICQLIHDGLLPEEKGFARTFRDFRRDRRFMWRLFEKFVLRFYQLEQSNYRVSAPKVCWRSFLAFDSDPQHVPEMRTDVVLRSVERTLVIDTKFYVKPLATNWQLNFAQHVKSVVVPDNVLFVGGAAPRIPLLLPCGIRPRFHEHEGKDVPHESVIARIVGHEDEPMIECGCGDEAVVDQ
jgi:5-methylcytosine-specific restriction enzyme subunit McrC